MCEILVAPNGPENLSQTILTSTNDLERMLEMFHLVRKTDRGRVGVRLIKRGACCTDARFGQMKLGQIVRGVGWLLSRLSAGLPAKGQYRAC